jgi:hypothetical protein
MAGSFRGVAGKRASGARRFRGRLLPSGGRPSSGRSSSTSGRGDAPSSKFLGSPRSHPTPPHPDQGDPYARGRGGHWTPVVLLHESSELFVGGRPDPAVLFGKLESMAAAAPNLRRTLLLPNCGHWTQQERPRTSTTSSWISSGRSSEATHLYPPDAHTGPYQLEQRRSVVDSAFLLATPARATWLVAVTPSPDLAELPSEKSRPPCPGFRDELGAQSLPAPGLAIRSVFEYIGRDALVPTMGCPWA